jgi:hypothetical protein
VTVARQPSEVREHARVDLAGRVEEGHQRELVEQQHHHRRVDARGAGAGRRCLSTSAGQLHELGGRREDEEHQREDERGRRQVSDEAPQRLVPCECDQRDGRNDDGKDKKQGSAKSGQLLGGVQNDDRHQHTRDGPVRDLTGLGRDEGQPGDNQPQGGGWDQQDRQRVGDDLDAVDTVEDERLRAAAGHVEQRLRDGERAKDEELDEHT